VITPGTHQLLAGLFAYDYLGNHSLKGVSEPVEAWIVEQEENTESRFQAIRSQRMTPLVGRVEEMEILAQRSDRTRRSEGQVVLITGEPGIGKSRVVETLAENLSSEGFVILRFQCSPHHKNSAFYPVIDHLERAVGMTRADTNSEKIQKLIAKFKTNNPADIPLLADLMSIPTDNSYPSMSLSPQQHKE
jgi:predicted ATPase